MRKIIYLIVLFLLIGSIYSIASKIELPDFDFDDIKGTEEVETEEPNDSNEPSSPEDTTETDSPSDTDESTETDEPEDTSCIHSYDSGFVSVKATCEHTGTIKYTCELCGYVKKEVIPKTDHSYEEQTQYESLNNTQHSVVLAKVCTVCQSETVISTTTASHDIQLSGDGGFDSEEPCLSYEYYHCTLCDYETEKQEYYAHDFGEDGHCTVCDAFDASYCQHSSRKNGVCESCGWNDPDWEDPSSTECPNSVNHSTGVGMYRVVNCTPYTEDSYELTLEYFCDWCDWTETAVEYGSCADLDSCNGH